MDDTTTDPIEELLRMIERFRQLNPTERSKMVTQTYGPICRGKKGLGDQIITNEMMDQRHELFLSLPQDVAENYVFGLLGWRKFHRGKPSGDAIKRDGMHLFFVPAIGTFIQTNFIEKVDLREYDSWFQWAHLNRMGEKLATRTTVTKEADLVARLIRQLPNAPWCVLPRPHPLQLQRNQLPYSQLNQHPPPSHNLPNLWPSEFNTLPAISGTPVKPNKQLPGVLSVLAGSYAIPDQSQEPVPTGTTARQQPAPYQNPQGFNQTPYAGASEPSTSSRLVSYPKPQGFDRTPSAEASGSGTSDRLMLPPLLLQGSRSRGNDHGSSQYTGDYGSSSHSSSHRTQSQSTSQGAGSGDGDRHTSSHHTSRHHSRHHHSHHRRHGHDHGYHTGESAGSSSRHDDRHERRHRSYTSDDRQEYRRPR